MGVDLFLDKMLPPRWKSWKQFLSPAMKKFLASPKGFVHWFFGDLNKQGGLEGGVLKDPVLGPSAAVFMNDIVSEFLILLGVNPCNLQCSCADWTGVVFNPQYITELDSFRKPYNQTARRMTDNWYRRGKGSPYHGQPPPTKLIPFNAYAPLNVPEWDWIDPVTDPKWLKAGDNRRNVKVILDSLKSSTVEEFQKKVQGHWDKRNTMLLDANVIACDHPPGREDTCIPGTQRMRYIITQRKRANKETVCKMSIDIRFSLCKSCCCKEGMATTQIDSNLVDEESLPNNQCKKWFGGIDAIFRMEVGIWKGFKIIDANSRKRCLDG